MGSSVAAAAAWSRRECSAPALCLPQACKRLNAWIPHPFESQAEKGFSRLLLAVGWPPWLVEGDWTEAAKTSGGQRAVSEPPPLAPLQAQQPAAHSSEATWARTAASSARPSRPPRQRESSVCLCASFNQSPDSSISDAPQHTRTPTLPMNHSAAPPPSSGPPRASSASPTSWARRRNSHHHHHHHHQRAASMPRHPMPRPSHGRPPPPPPPRLPRSPRRPTTPPRPSTRARTPTSASCASAWGRRTG